MKPTDTSGMLRNLESLEVGETTDGSRVSWSAEVRSYLRGYRSRSRRLSSPRTPLPLLVQARRMSELLLTEPELAIHASVLVGMLYFGSSLTSEELQLLTPFSVQEQGSGELVVEPPVPSAIPRQVWLDAETAEILKAYLARLTPGREVLFCNALGQPLTQEEIYQIALSIPDEEEDALYEHFFPVYHESDYSVIPTPLRLNADHQYTGRGVTIAFIDSGFYPHPDLTRPRNRVRKYVNIADPDLDDFHIPSESSWHGMQTSLSAAGNGYLSGGLYKGVAPDADVVLLKVRGRQGIQTRYILEAFEWCIRHQREYNIRIINISLSGDRPGSYLRSALDQAAEAAVQAGIVVVVAAGNSGWDNWSESICPPASAPSVITVGGLNDNNQLNVNAYEMYWSSYGPTVDGILKPELVAPGIWIAAPILPGTPIHLEAHWVHELNTASDAELSELVVAAVKAGVPWPLELAAATPEVIRQELKRVAQQKKLVPPHYQHVDGTSFSAPIVCSVIAQMLEANSLLTPARIKQILTTTADKLYNVPLHRQGHGLIHPRKSVKEAANDLHRTGRKRPNSPHVQERRVSFYYRDLQARQVAVAGDFNKWSTTSHRMTFLGPDTWFLTLDIPATGSFRYKFVVDGREWKTDPENQNREPDGFGGLNARVNVLI